MKFVLECLSYMIERLLGDITAFIMFLQLKFHFFGGKRRTPAQGYLKFVKRDRSLHLEPIVLDSIRKIANCSFIVHKSVNHLDLSTCEYSSLKMSNSGYPSRMIFTEEGWRKLVPGRQLFYSMNLDTANGLERRLKAAPISVLKPFEPFNEILVCESLYKKAFSSFIFKAVLKSDKKVKLLGKLMKLMKRVSFDFCVLSPIKMEYFMNILYKECNDSFIVRDFLTLFSFKKCMLYSKRPEVWEYLLNHAQRSGYLSCVLNNNTEQDCINVAFRQLNFIKVKMFFKFIDAPKFSANEFVELLMVTFSLPYLNHIGAVLSQLLVLELPYNRRNFLMVQILWAFEEVRRPAVDSQCVEDSMRLIWMSIPESIITWEEIKLKLGDAFPLNYLKRVVEFYHGVVGETPSEPRSLQHFCRTTIRETLYKNFQLPNGISQVGLPPKLQAYVRLEI